MSKYDFSGWATKNDLRCSDGRTIRRNAFAGDDGHTVPLVWQHSHNNPENVLGHALLQNKDEGVYAYCTFNNTDSARHAKELIRHGDICALSIYANGLKQDHGDVLHGSIKEVSLVLAGANPGALIDYMDIQHGEDAATEALIYTNMDISIEHADEPEEGEKKMADSNKEKTVKDVFDTFNEEQKNVVYYLVGQAMDSK